MHDPIAEAVVRAAEHGAPAKTYEVGPNAAVEFGTGPNPFEHMTVTHWSHDG